MPTRSRSFAATSAVASRFMPWTEPDLVLLRNGGFIGFQHGTGRTCYIDIQHLIKEKLVKNGNIGVAAPIGHGKDVLSKSLAVTLGGQQAGVTEGVHVKPRTWAIDLKLEAGQGEWTGISQFYRSQSVVLNNDRSFNMLAPHLGVTDVDHTRLLSMVLNFTMSKPLSAEALLGIQMVTFFLQKFKANLGLELVTEQLQRVTKESLKEYLGSGHQQLKKRYQKERDANPEFDAYFAPILTVDPAIVREDALFLEFQRACSETATAISNLQNTGLYGQLWNGTESVYEHMGGRFTHWDMIDLPEAGVGVFEIVLKHIEDIVGRENGGDSKIRPHYVFNDEQGSEMTSLPHAKVRAEASRKVRAGSTISWDLYQNITDPLSIGDAGSELRGLGEVMFKNMGAWFLGAMPNDDDTLHAVTRVGATDEEAYRTTSLQEGDWAFISKGHPAEFFHQYLLPSVEPLIDTTSGARRAAARVPVNETATYNERQAALLIEPTA